MIPAAGGVQGPRAEGLGWQVGRAVLNTACTSRMEGPVDMGSPGTRGTGRQLVGSSRYLERSLLKQDGKQGQQRGRNLKGILLRGEGLGEGRMIAKVSQNLRFTRGNVWFQSPEVPRIEGISLQKEATKSWCPGTSHG